VNKTKGKSHKIKVEEVEEVERLKKLKG